MLISGQTDLIHSAASIPVQTTLKGKPVVIIYGTLGSAVPTTELWGSSSVKSLQQLESMNSCRVASTPPGSGIYASLNYWKSKFGLKCDIVSVQTVPLLVAGVQSGSYDAAVIPRNQIGVAPSGINVLISIKDPQYADQYVIPGQTSAIGGVLSGIPDTLKSNRDAVIRFCRALQQAYALMKTLTVDQLVTDLQNAEDWFRATPADTLRASITVGLPSEYSDPTTGKPGFISQKTWQATADYLSYFGIQGYDPKTPAASYSSAVDMSYLNAASKT